MDDSTAAALVWGWGQIRRDGARMLVLSAEAWARTRCAGAPIEAQQVGRRGTTAERCPAVRSARLLPAPHSLPHAASAEAFAAEGPILPGSVAVASTVEVSMVAEAFVVVVVASMVEAAGEDEM